MNQEITTENTENTETNTEKEPDQPVLPGIETEAETRALGSVSNVAHELLTENKALKAELYIRAAVYDIQTRLTNAGARSADLLADKAKQQFQFSDEGELTNAEAVIEHLRKTYPEQFTPPSIDASAGRSVRATLTKEALARMTPAEIQRLDWAKVRSALQER